MRERARHVRLERVGVAHRGARRVGRAAEQLPPLLQRRIHALRPLERAHRTAAQLLQLGQPREAAQLAALAVRLQPDDERMLEDLWRSARAMERRIESLESIISGETERQPRSENYRDDVYRKN